jgi:hypothetical protein
MICPVGTAYAFTVKSHGKRIGWILRTNHRITEYAMYVMEMEYFRSECMCMYGIFARMCVYSIRNIEVRKSISHYTSPHHTTPHNTTYHITPAHKIVINIISILSCIAAHLHIKYKCIFSFLPTLYSSLLFTGKSDCLIRYFLQLQPLYEIHYLHQ